jgi:hypothetical protein
VSLTERTPPSQPKTFDPDLELVVVLETSDAFALAVAKGSLKDAGIPFFVLNEISMLVTDVDPMLHKSVRIQVARDREAEARDIIAPLLQADDGIGGNT